MQLTVKYFGMLAEVTKCEEEIINEEGTTVVEFLETLYNKYPILKDKDFQIAQNQKLITKETLLSSGELALLPPFAGG
ncbi:MoaD/ThiS family protein [Pontimicrobium sp. MEBiC01747]